MTSDRPPRLRLFETADNQRHIEAADHYLYARPIPRYRVAVIGAGTMGQEHIRIAQLMGSAEVHGIYDPHTSSVDVVTAMSHAINTAAPKRYGSLDELASDEDLDAVFICTPNHTHRSVFEAVLASGKAIYIEKPMATTLNDAAAMMRMAEGYPAPIQLGLQYRFKAPYKEAWHEYSSRKSLGALHTISLSEYRPPFLDKVGQWNKFNRYSGGTLIEKCCHYFDLINRFAERQPLSVYAQGGRAVNFRDFSKDGNAADIDDHAFVIVNYEGGLKAQFTLNMFSPVFHETMTLVGSQGRLVAEEHFDPQRPGDGSSRLRVEAHEPDMTRDIALSYGDIIEASGHHGATYHAQKAFIDRLDGKHSEAASLNAGLWSLLVAAAAQQSMTCGNVVAISDLVNDADLQDILN